MRKRLVDSSACELPPLTQEERQENSRQVRGGWLSGWMSAIESRKVGHSNQCFPNRIISDRIDRFRVRDLEFVPTHLSRNMVYSLSAKVNRVVGSGKPKVWMTQGLSAPLVAAIWWWRWIYSSVCDKIRKNKMWSVGKPNPTFFFNFF